MWCCAVAFARRRPGFHRKAEARGGGPQAPDRGSAHGSRGGTVDRMDTTEHLDLVVAAEQAGGDPPGDLGDLDRWGRLFALAVERHGVITLAAAAEVGLSAQAVRRRAAREGWTKLTRGAWLAPGAPDTQLVRASAHLQLLGERAALGIESATFLHGLLPTSPTAPVVLLPNDRHLAGRAGVTIRRSRTLLTRDLTEVQGLAVTRVARTLRDLAPGQRWDDCYDLVTEAEQRRLVTLDELTEVAGRLGHGPGSGRFASVIDTRCTDRSDSALERDTRRSSRAAGYRPSEGPFPVRVRTGRVLHLDVAFAPVWFGIECDGLGFHSARAAFERDRDRWRLLQQAGWRLTWVTRRRLRDDLDGLLEEIAEAHRLATAHQGGGASGHALRSRPRKLRRMRTSLRNGYAMHSPWPRITSKGLATPQSW